VVVMADEDLIIKAEPVVNGIYHEDPSIHEWIEAMARFGQEVRDEEKKWARANHNEAKQREEDLKKEIEELNQTLNSMGQGKGEG